MSFSTYTQRKTGGWGLSAGPASVTLDSAVASGSLIVLGISWYSSARTITGITDSDGNTYQPAGGPYTGDNRSTQIFYCYPALGGALAPTIDAAFSGSGAMWWIIGASEWPGVVGAADPLVDENGGFSHPTVAPYDLSAGVVTPTQAGCLMIAFYESLVSTRDAGPPGASVVNTGVYFGVDYAVLASMDAYDATMSFVGEALVITAVALFKADTVTWVPIADFEEPVLDATQYPAGTARVVCDLWTEDLQVGSPAPSITARLVSLLESRDGLGQREVDAEVGRSATVQATVPIDASFPVTLAGIKHHRLEVTSDTAAVDLFCGPGAEVRL